jgi:hypothetical protein
LILPGALAGLIEQIHELLLGTACRSMEPQRLCNVRYPMNSIAQFPREVEYYAGNVWGVGRLFVPIFLARMGLIRSIMDASPYLVCC